MKRVIFYCLFCLIITSPGCKKEDDKQETVTDIDGNVYHTVTIGTQVWMAENLKTTKFRNGEMIWTTELPNEDITNETDPVLQWPCFGDEKYSGTYGRLYTFYAITDNRNIAPEGWHVSTDYDWYILESYLDSTITDPSVSDFRGYNAGGGMKEKGTRHWYIPNEGATNISGLTALPAGYRDIDNYFYFTGYQAHFWTTYSNSESTAWCRLLSFNNSQSGRFIASKYSGLSVRCVKDNY